MEWIVDGLEDLRRIVQEHKIRSIALPPPGAGNGRLEWSVVRVEFSERSAILKTSILLCTNQRRDIRTSPNELGWKNSRRRGVLVAEMIRRYWVLGIECTYLEVQKLRWFLEHTIHALGIEDPLKLHFQADKYAPYSERLRHLLNALDGTYLRCDKRLSDAGPTDTIWFDEDRRKHVELFLQQESSKSLNRVLDLTCERIDGF